MSIAAEISLNSQGSSEAAFCDPQLSDDRLVAAAKTGDIAAFDQLHERHSKKVFRVTHRITRNREDAKDAAQESFLNAFIHLNSFDGRSRFSTWLTRIAINAALMKLRKDRAWRSVSIGESAETSQLGPEHRLAGSSANPEECYANSQREAIVRDAIAKLRPKIRKAIEIHHFQECSLHETAEILGISAGAAKARLFHARTALRKTSQLQFVIPSLWKDRARLTRRHVKVQKRAVTLKAKVTSKEILQELQS